MLYYSVRPAYIELFVPEWEFYAIVQDGTYQRIISAKHVFPAYTQCRYMLWVRVMFLQIIHGWIISFLVAESHI